MDEFIRRAKIAVILFLEGGAFVLILFTLAMTIWYFTLDKEAPEQIPEEVDIVVEHEIGIASFYDYDIAEDGFGYPCVYGTGCYTEDVNIAASRDYERGTMLRVTYNDKSVDVKVTDYGPMNCEDRVKNGFDQSLETCTERIIDLSSHAFLELSSMKHGLITVKIEEL